MIERKFRFVRQEVTYRLYVYPGYAYQGTLGRLYAMLRDTPVIDDEPSPLSRRPSAWQRFVEWCRR